MTFPAPSPSNWRDSWRTSIFGAILVAVGVLQLIGVAHNVGGDPFAHILAGVGLLVAKDAVQ